MTPAPLLGCARGCFRRASIGVSSRALEAPRQKINAMCFTLEARSCGHKVSKASDAVGIIGEVPM